MTLADYLAKNYLTADSKPDKKSKKRKRKDGSASGLVIADDDASGWEQSGSRRGGDGDDDDDGPLTLNSASAEFRRAKRSAWTAVGVPAPSSADQAAADAILASAAAETDALRSAAADEDAPTVVDDTSENVKTMESGAHAGLQSASAVTAQLEARKAAERARFQAEQASGTGNSKHNETIYRDASGRIINVAMQRAEARKAAAEREAREAAAKDALKGDVQKKAQAERATALKEAKYLPLARGADDEEMNDELMKRERWDDPLSKFAPESPPPSSSGKQKAKSKKGKSVSGRPLYKGHAPPNRYAIRPGHRWDGVQRGIGFEGKWFAARNKRADRANLEYQWQMDE